jgi:hypothetical protein
MMRIQWLAPSSGAKRLFAKCWLTAAKAALAGKSALLRAGNFGDYLCLNTKATCYVHGGGFDHYGRCGPFFLRGWSTDAQRWYLYGSRLIYKPLHDAQPKQTREATPVH